MNISKVGQASAADIEIAALASAAVAASESAAVVSTSAASALARTSTKAKNPVKRLQIGMQISTPTQRKKPTTKPSQRQAVSPSLLRRPHLLT